MQRSSRWLALPFLGALLLLLGYTLPVVADNPALIMVFTRQEISRIFGGDVVVTAPVSTGDAITWDGASWVNQPGGAVPVGTVTMFGMAVPSGYLECDGSAVSQATYANLYAEIGLTYGDPGGGNFNLPDCRGRGPIGSGSGPGLTARSRGDTGGSESVGTSTNGAHDHSIIDTQVAQSGAGATCAGTNDTGSVGDHGHTAAVMDPFACFTFGIKY